MQTHIYLADVPATPHARRVLRSRALDLHARFAPIDGGPCTVLLNLAGRQQLFPVDLLVLRPRSVLVGVVYEVEQPFELRPDGCLVSRATGAPLQPGDANAPLQYIRAVRDGVLPLLIQALPAHHHIAHDRAALGSVIGATIISPALHAESRVQIKPDDHRQRLKLFGFDELAPLCAMLQAGAQLSEATMQQLVASLGSTLWHNGEQLLFEIGLSAYRLHMLAGEASTEMTFPLLEGANVVGRRTQSLGTEYRLTLPDDAISADHAVVVCGTSGQVVLRDTSTNGTYVRPPGGDELRVHHADQRLVPGAIIRMGQTRMRLEA